MFTMNKMRGVVTLGVVLILTSIVHNVHSQAHHHACLNSHFQPELDGLEEDEEWGKCFFLQLTNMDPSKTSGNPNRMHISVIWIRGKVGSDCRQLNVVWVEVMARGSQEMDDYRYPIGKFSLTSDEASVCPPSSTSQTWPSWHHLDFLSFSKETLETSRVQCQPERISSPGDSDLYRGETGFALFNWKPQYKHPVYTNNYNKLLACAIWEFTEATPSYTKYIMDFTAQIKLIKLPGGDKFVQIGLKQVSVNITTSTEVTDSCGPNLTGQTTTNVLNGTPTDQNTLRPDVPPISTTPTPTTTTTLPHPDPVTNLPPVIIMKPTSPRPPTKSTTPHSTVNSGKDSVFEGCLFTKTCVTDKVITADNNCLATKSCGVVVSFGEGSNATPEPDETVLEIYGSAGSWIAMGLSEDRVMGDDLVIECVREKDKVNIYLSWNHVDSNCHLGPLRNLCQDNRRMKGEKSADGVIRPILASAFENTIYCRFYLKLKIDRVNPWGGHSKEFNLKHTDYHVLLAQGDGVRESGPHGNIATHRKGDAYATLLKTNLAKRLSPYPHQVRYLKFHGMSMVLGCLFFMPVGIFVARYLKDTYVHKQVFGVILWKFMHGMFMVSAFLCLVAGTIFYILGKQGWTPQKSDFHSTGGNICLSLVVVMTFTGFFTKERTPGRVNIINVCHGVVGHFIYLMSCALIIEAGKVHYSNVSCSFRWILICWLVCYFLMHVVMSYHYCWVDYIAGVPARGYGLTPMTILVQNIPTASHHHHQEENVDEASLAHPAHSVQEIRDGFSHLEAPGTLLRLYAVGIFTTVNLLYVVVLLRKLNLAKSCHTLEDYIKLYKTRS